MIFDKNSGLVKMWVNLVQNGTYSKDQIPKMFNLQDIVNEILNEKEE